MSDFIKFFLLGLGSGGAYSLLALGVVLVYRGSGVVNFAHGAIALFGVSVFYEFRHPVGSPLAIILGVLASALLGVLIQMAVMRPMRRSSPLMRVVATLGVLSVLQEGAIIKFGSNPLFIPDFLPSHAVHFSKHIVVGEDRIINLAIAVVLTVGLWIIYRKTRFGIATAALAENERATATLGWSPTILAVGNWAAGGALAGLAGILLAPITGLSPSALTLAVVPALAAGLLGGFSSFPLTMLGGLLIGVLESETTRYITTPGWPTAIPFLAIIVLLVLRGRALPLRSHTFERLPKIGSGNLKLGALLIGMGVFSVSLVAFSDNWAAAMSTAAVYGFISLSLVVVVGFCGQLSLAQFAIAGIGAFISTRLADTQHLGFPLAFLIGLAATIPIGVIVAIPAVRVRGVNLAVITLGLAVVVSDVILSNSAYTGGAIRGTVVKPASVFGLSVYSVLHPQRWAGVGLVLFIVAGLIVANVRRGRSGRRMIAVRDNERAAASLGVSVMGTKLYAFAVGAGLAAIGGMLLVYANTNIVFSPFDVLSSVNVLLIAVIGSIGYTSGAVVGGIGNSGGPAQQIISHLFKTGNWYLFVAGLLTITVLIANPDGLISQHATQLAWIRARLGLKRRAGRVWDLDVPEGLRKVAPKSLEVEDLGVSFGGVKALDGVSLRLEPGQVVGLIGPNGAGKTTLIDAVTGFIRNYRGTIKLDGVSINGDRATTRARSGLTRSFQSLELFEDLSVADNLRAAADPQDRLALATDLVRPGKPKLGPEAAVSVREFQLEDSLNSLPRELPYAKRRLVAIARAVASRPSVLLLDEPAAGLDTTSTAELSHLIRRLAKDWGMAILLIEHDVNMVLNTCDEVVVLHFGQRIARGTPEEIRHDPTVIEAYLGTTPTSSPTAVGAGPESVTSSTKDVEL
ncbi:MAG: ATP-binding cassette domain-containing protein [Acidimicrobiales bacterium]|nr:ATP-binding cassette domain-containing protein [Acidimicrobiales bacterium]